MAASVVLAENIIPEVGLGIPPACVHVVGVAGLGFERVDEFAGEILDAFQRGKGKAKARRAEAGSTPRQSGVLDLTPPTTMRCRIDTWWPQPPRSESGAGRVAGNLQVAGILRIHQHTHEAWVLPDLPRRFAVLRAWIGAVSPS